MIEYEILENRGKQSAENRGGQVRRPGGMQDSRNNSLIHLLFTAKGAQKTRKGDPDAPY
jgi:hypothetical protein